MQLLASTAAMLICSGGILCSSLPAVAAAPYMDCDGAALCGVLALETGLGSGPYDHSTPALHGLWPETGKYGSSQCIAPTRSSADPEVLFPCYDVDAVPHKQLAFERYEWRKHGQCAGTRDADDYFRQACALSRGPLQRMAAERAGGTTELGMFARRLEALGYPVYATDQRTMQLELAACAGGDGQWILAKPSEFRTRCGGPRAETQVKQATTTQVEQATLPTASTLQCVRNVKGPKCATDADCGYSGCLRCAKSGFCTDQALPSG